MLPKGRDIAP